MCQRQRDLFQDMVATGHLPAQASLINRDRMEEMGKDLIQLCDQLEQHGLVDYQIGIWEEEILSGTWLVIFLSAMLLKRKACARAYSHQLATPTKRKRERGNTDLSQSHYSPRSMP